MKREIYRLSYGFTKKDSFHNFGTYSELRPELKRTERDLQELLDKKSVKETLEGPDAVLRSMRASLNQTSSGEM